MGMCENVVVQEHTVGDSWGSSGASRLMWRRAADLKRAIDSVQVLGLRVQHALAVDVRKQLIACMRGGEQPVLREEQRARVSTEPDQQEDHRWYHKA